VIDIFRIEMGAMSPVNPVGQCPWRAAQPPRRLEVIRAMGGSSVAPGVVNWSLGHRVTMALGGRQVGHSPRQPSRRSHYPIGPQIRSEVA